VVKLVPWSNPLLEIEARARVQATSIAANHFHRSTIFIDQLFSSVSSPALSRASAGDFDVAIYRPPTLIDQLLSSINCFHRPTIFTDQLFPSGS
jgi:hypothetical protein